MFLKNFHLIKFHTGGCCDLFIQELACQLLIVGLGLLCRSRNLTSLHVCWLRAVFTKDVIKSSCSLFFMFFGNIQFDEIFTPGVCCDLIVQEMASQLLSIGWRGLEPLFRSRNLMSFQVIWFRAVFKKTLHSKEELRGFMNLEMDFIFSLQIQASSFLQSYFR